MRSAPNGRSAGPSPWWLLLLALLPLISFAMHFRGLMVLGWDSEPSLRPDQFLASSLSAWTFRSYLGQPNVFQLSQAPLALLYVLLAWPFGVAVADKLLLGALFVLPAFTLYYCARRLFPRDPWLPFVAAWCYALCPLLFVRYYIPIMSVQLVYALLPLLVNVWVNIAREGANARRLLWLALVEIAFLPAANNLAYWLVPHVTAFAVVVLEGAPGRVWLSREQVKSIGRALIVTVLINGFWLASVVFFGLISGPTIEHEAITRAYTTGVRADVAAGSSLSYSLRMSSRVQTGAADSYGTYWTYARSLENGLIAAPFFIWIVLAGLAIALRPRDRRVIVLGLLLCGALFIMKGESPPFAFILQTFYRIPLLGTIFRNGNDKLIPMAAFAMSLLMPIGLAMLARKTRTVRLWQPVLLVAVLAMAFPYWTGQMFMARSQGPTLASMPPPDAFTFTRALDGLRSRVLFVPVSDNPQLLATTWGFYGPNVYGSMTDAGFVAMPASPLNVPGTDDVTTAIHRAIRTGDVATFVALTRDAGIGYVFVAHDMDPTYYGGPPGSYIDSFLGKLPGTQIASIVGNYTLWHLTWVGDVHRELVRREIVGYNTTFDNALLLAPQCGTTPMALIPLAKNAACAVLLSPLGTPEARAELHPARASIHRGRLRIERAGLASAVASIPLPHDTLAANVETVTIAGEPTGLSLQPCARYRVETYLGGGEGVAATPSYALPAPDAAYVPVRPGAPGLHLVTMRVTPDGAGASVSLSDAVTSQTLVDAGKLRLDRSRFLFDAMPGRAYELALGANGLLLLPRSFVQSVTLSDASVGPTLSIFAPPETPAACPPPAAVPPTYQVRAPSVMTTMVVRNGRALALPWDAAAGAVASAALPRDVAMLRYGTDYVGADATDVELPTGSPVTLHLYRTAGPRRPLALEKMGSATDNTVSNADPAAGTAALVAPTVNERWMRVSLPPDCAPECVVTIAISSIIGDVGATITDAASGSVVVTEKEVRKPVLSIGYHAQAGVAHDLYVYTESRNGGTASALQIASMLTVPVVPAGTASLTLPRLRPAFPAEVGALQVVGALPGSGATFDGSHLLASGAQTALVLDTQFDPFWTTLVLPGRSPWVYFPQHVQADGYKNAWLIEPGISGNVVHFYLIDLLALLGAIVAAVTVLALALRSMSGGRRRRTAGAAPR